MCGGLLVEFVRVRSCVCVFFQAEDGIRDSSVTGVQTCALPISNSRIHGRTQLQQSATFNYVKICPKLTATPSKYAMKRYQNIAPGEVESHDQRNYQIWSFTETWSVWAI